MEYSLELSWKLCDWCIMCNWNTEVSRSVSMWCEDDIAKGSSNSNNVSRHDWTHALCHGEDTHCLPVSSLQLEFDEFKERSAQWWSLHMMCLSWAHAYPIMFIRLNANDCADPSAQNSWEQPWAPFEISLILWRSIWRHQGDICKYLRKTSDINPDISQKQLRYRGRNYHRLVLTMLHSSLERLTSLLISRLCLTLVYYDYRICFTRFKSVSVCAAPSVIVKLQFCPPATLADSFEL